jgi:excinuclease ABC subunit A
VRNTILWGFGGAPIAMTCDDGLRKYTTERPFEGVLPNMERRDEGSVYGSVTFQR